MRNVAIRIRNIRRLSHYLGLAIEQQQQQQRRGGQLIELPVHCAQGGHGVCAILNELQRCNGGLRAGLLTLACALNACSMALTKSQM